MKWKVTFLQFPVSTLPLSQRWGWGREIPPSVNTHPHYAIVAPLCPHHPRSVVKVLPVTSPSFHHPCHCTVTLLSLLLSCPWLLGFLDWVNYTGGIYVFGWYSELGALSAPGESLCCIAALRQLGLLDCIRAVRLPFTGERQPVGFREVCQ